MRLIKCQKFSELNAALPRGFSNCPVHTDIEKVASKLHKILLKQASAAGLQPALNIVPAGGFLASLRLYTIFACVPYPMRDVKILSTFA
jgi:hypothetical protein